MIKNLNRNNSVNSIAFYFFVFSFFGFLAFFFVPVSDDIFFFYKFGTSIKDAFVNALFYGNGRLLGNFIEIIIQKYTVVRVTLIATVLTWLISLIIRLSGLDNTKQFFVPLFFIATLHPNFFAESIHWMAAFCNYVIPLTLFLESLYYILNDAVHKRRKHILICVLCFLGCFFSENTTLVFFFVFGFTFLQQYVKTKKINVLLFLTAVCSGVGTVMMFLIPCFVGRTDAMDSYRHTVFGKNLIDIIKFIFGQAGLVSKFFSGMTAVLFSISILVFLIMRKKDFQVFNRCKFLFIFQCFSLVFLFCDIVLLSDIEYKSKLFEYIVITARVANVVLYFVSTFFSVGIYEIKILKKSSRPQLISWLLGVVISTVPLLIIDPIGYRLAFMPFIFLCIVACTLLNMFLKDCCSKKNIINLIFNILVVLVVTICGTLLFVFGKNKDNYYERDAYIRQEINAGKTEIVLPELMFPEYVCVSRTDYIWPKHYGYEEKEVTFEYISREEWIKSKTE